MRRRNFSSKFSFRCSIRLLEFHCSIRFLEFQFSIRISIRVSNASSLIFRVEFAVEIFDVLLYSTSRISLLNSISRISIVDSTSRFKSLEFDDSKLSSNFEFVLIYSTSRISICDFDSKL